MKHYREFPMKNKDEKIFLLWKSFFLFERWKNFLALFAMLFAAWIDFHLIYLRQLLNNKLLWWWKAMKFLLIL